jgi:transposase
MSILGIGIRTATLLIAEIWDMNRFKNKDNLCAYVGFSPRLFGSGDKERMKNGGNRKHKQLQSKLIEAAWRVRSCLLSIYELRAEGQRKGQYRLLQRNFYYEHVLYGYTKKYIN